MAEIRVHSRRSMLAVIALADEVPAPTEIVFGAEERTVALRLATMGDGAAWLELLAPGMPRSVNLYQDAPSQLLSKRLRWYGWEVTLVVHDDAFGPLSPDMAVALVEMVTEAEASRG